jgi:hypothetical protein
MKYTLFIFLVSFYWISCTYENEEDFFGKNDCEPKNASYSQHIQSILNNHCGTSGCHIAGGSSPVLFENYQQTKSKVDDGTFYNRVIVLRNMPPHYALSDCQIQYIKYWHDIGAPDN